MKVVRLLVPIVLAGLFAVSCSESSGPTSPSSIDRSLDFTGSQFAGTWNLVSIQVSRQAEQAKPSGASYTVTFADGRLSTLADCNRCGGTYTLTGRTLAVGPALACTRAACATMAFETVYTRLLTGESAVTLSENTLVLMSPRGVLRFSR